MRFGLPKSRLLVAVLRAEDRVQGRDAARKLELVEMGSLVAVTRRTLGKDDDLFAEAVRHDRIMGRLCEGCSAVVPFRLGVTAGSDDDLRRFLREHVAVFEAALRRFEGHVEMGLKIKAKDGRPLPQAPHLDAIHALSMDPRDRREREVTRGGARIFEGAYLVAKAAVEEFWSATESLRGPLGGSPVLGTGPWAPYSFCDFQLEWADATTHRGS